MKNSMIKTLLLLSLLAPCHTIRAEISQSDSEIHNLNKQLNNSLVYIDDEVRQNIVDLQEALPNHAWSLSYRNLCKDIRNEGTVVTHDFMSHVLNECFAACSKLSESDAYAVRTTFVNYVHKLANGKAHINAADDESENDIATDTRGCCKKKKPKKICSLCVEQCLSAGALSVAGNVTIGGTLIVGGVNFNTLAGIAGAPGVAGAIGAAGAAGAPGTMGVPGIPGIGGVLGWGYIYNLGQLTNSNGKAIAPQASIPFDSAGPLNGVTYALLSGAIHVTSAGTYLIDFSVSGTEPNQFAIAVNGVPNTSTVYGAGAGTEQNNGQAIITLAANDVITLINHTSAGAVQLFATPPIGGTAAAINASVVILRIA